MGDSGQTVLIKSVLDSSSLRYIDNFVKIHYTCRCIGGTARQMMAKSVGSADRIMSFPKLVRGATSSDSAVEYNSQNHTVRQSLGWVCLEAYKRGTPSYFGFHSTFPHSKTPHIYTTYHVLSNRPNCVFLSRVSTSCPVFAESRANIAFQRQDTDHCEWVLWAQLLCLCEGYLVPHLASPPSETYRPPCASKSTYRLCSTRT
jgi:hypothetical protein